MRDNPGERNRMIIEEFRANGGKVGGNFANAHILLLSHKGAKTGEARINPLMYLQDGKRYLVFASMGGAPKNPAWYHNLVANPNVSIEVGTRKMDAKAKVITGTEHDEIYDRMAKAFPQFDDYRKRTTRKIPVIALEPV